LFSSILHNSFKHDTQKVTILQSTDCRSASRPNVVRGRGQAADAYARAKEVALHTIRQGDREERITVVEAVRRIGMEYRAVVMEAQGALGKTALDTFKEISRHAQSIRGIPMAMFQMHWRRRLSATLNRALGDAAVARARAISTGRVALRQGYQPFGGSDLSEADFGAYTIR